MKYIVNWTCETLQGECSGELDFTREELITWEEMSWNEQLNELSIDDSMGEGLSWEVKFIDMPDGFSWRVISEIEAKRMLANHEGEVCIFYPVDNSESLVEDDEQLTNRHGDCYIVTNVM